MVSAIMAMIAFGVSGAFAGQGEKIKFSEPSSPVLTSNMSPALSPALNPFNASPGGFHQVQEDLFGPLRNSMRVEEPVDNGAFMPMFHSQSQAPTKRERQLLDQRRNWAFTDLNDLYPDLTMGQKLEQEDQKAMNAEKTPGSLIERYYENRGQSPSLKLKNSNPDFYGVRQTLTNAGLSFLTNAYSQNDSSIKAILAAAVMTGDASALSTLGGLGIAHDRQQEDFAAKKRMDEFRHLLDPNLPPTRDMSHVDPFNSGNFDQTAALANKNNNSGGSPQIVQARRIMSTQLSGTVDPTLVSLHSQITDDPTAAALGLPNPTRAKPIVASPTKTLQQILDPYEANKPKPKF